MVTQGRVNRIQRAIHAMTRREMLRTGTIVLYTPRRRCSCMTVERKPMIGCRICDGFGWYWIDAEERRARAILQDIRFDRRFKDYGAMQQGDLTITFDRFIDPAPYLPGPYDRVRLSLDQLRQFDIAAEDVVLQRGDDSAIDRVPHRLATVVHLASTDPYAGTVATYRDGIDFSWATGQNTITWLDGVGAVAPGEGENFALSYLADYDWICMQPPAPRHVGSSGVVAPMILTRHARDERLDDALYADEYA